MSNKTYNTYESFGLTLFKSLSLRIASLDIMQTKEVTFEIGPRYETVRLTLHDGTYATLSLMRPDAKKETHT